jgi:hypothetical protein
MQATQIRSAIAAYIHDRLVRECTAERGRAAAIARATGVTTAHVANVKNGKASAGEDFSRALAVYWSMSYQQLENAAVEWFRSHRPRPIPAAAQRRWEEVDPRYPNLAESLSIVRREGQYEASFLDEIERTKLRSERDLPTTVWLKMIELESELRRRASRRGAVGMPVDSEAVAMAPSQTARKRSRRQH